MRTSPSFHVPHLAVPPEGISLKEVIASFERRLIESTLESTGGVQKEAARLLGLKPTTLNEMIKRHNILLPRERERERKDACARWKRPRSELDAGLRRLSDLDSVPGLAGSLAR